MGLPCDHQDVKISTKCEIELWTPVKKISTNLTAKMLCKNSNSPVLPLDTRTLLIYISEPELLFYFLFELTSIILWENYYYHNTKHTIYTS